MAWMQVARMQVTWKLSAIFLPCSIHAIDAFGTEKQVSTSETLQYEMFKGVASTRGGPWILIEEPDRRSRLGSWQCTWPASGFLDQSNRVKSDYGGISPEAGHEERSKAFLTLLLPEATSEQKRYLITNVERCSRWAESCLLAGCAVCTV